MCTKDEHIKEEHILIMTEDDLLPGAFSSIALPPNIPFPLDFSRNRKILFFSTRFEIAICHFIISIFVYVFRKFSHQEKSILCLVEVVGIEPNINCVTSKVISRVWIPLTTVDNRKPSKHI